MNKEFNKEKTGSLWLADKQTIKGEPYYNGTITIDNKDYSITMFINKSDNLKAPKFRLKVNEKKESQDIIKNIKEDEPYIDFGNSIELNDEDIAF